MYLARSLTNHSLEEIGGHLGGRDHTTVMHAWNKIGQVKENDAEVRALLDELTKQISRAAQSA
jgi:chromosomal replication initiator protein